MNTIKNDSKVLVVKPANTAGGTPKGSAKKATAPKKEEAPKPAGAESRKAEELEKQLAELREQLKESEASAKKLATIARKAEEERDSAKKPASIEDILVKTEALKTLTHQRDYMLGKKRELQAFIFSKSETTGGTLTLTARSGQVFNTESTVVLQEVRDMILTMINQNLIDTERKMQEVMQD